MREIEWIDLNVIMSNFKTKKPIIAVLLKDGNDMLIKLKIVPAISHINMNNE